VHLIYDLHPIDLCVFYSHDELIGLEAAGAGMDHIPQPPARAASFGGVLRRLEIPKGFSHIMGSST
jgi:hypothetical protein